MEFNFNFSDLPYCLKCLIVYHFVKNVHDNKEKIRITSKLLTLNREIKKIIETHHVN